VKKTLEALDGPALEGQRVLVRVDFNVPLAEGQVADDTRIRAALKTISWLRTRGCRVVLMSHLGRPKGKVVPALSLRPLIPVLEHHLGAPVLFIEDPLSNDAVQRTRRMKRGEVALVENTRFWPGEETNAGDFAEALARLGDFFVNDAFGAAHRAHATTEGLAFRLRPAVAGFLMAKELEHLDAAVTHPRRPFVAVIGGAKISGKIDVIEALLPKVDEILLGGAMANTFFLAMGFEVGTSLVEPDRVEIAQKLLENAGDKIVLPTGAVVAQQLSGNAEIREVARESIEPGWSVYDIDHATVADFTERILAARTVVWNGPMGVFETPPFDAGTLGVAAALAEATEHGTITVVGGGDSAAALALAGLQGRITHLSTGGGASLEYLEGKPLPGVEALNDA
jgi:phosphoglycerate kinase